MILDFYKGHLDAMIERITQADFSFVMYYAPWDAESQVLRHEFESVARFYYPQVQNCHLKSYISFLHIHKHMGIVCVLRYSSQLLIVGIPIQNVERNIIKSTVIQY